MVADELTPGGAGAAAVMRRRCHGSGLCWDWTRYFERFLRENPNGLSGALNGSDRPGSAATPGSPAPGNPPAPPSAPAPPAQSGDHDGAQGSSAAETSKAVDSIIESLWKEDASSGAKRAIRRRGNELSTRGSTACRTFVWFTSWETVSLAHDSSSESNGFGNRRGAMTLPLRGPGKDEPSLAAPLAFVVLANEWRAGG